MTAFAGKVWAGRRHPRWWIAVFDAAFEPFRQSIGVDRLPEPERSRIAARQRIRQDLVVGYWDEMLLIRRPS
jgi:hypothetical protein